MNYKSIDNKFNTFLFDIKKYFMDKKNITLFDKRNIIKIIDYNDSDYVVKSFKVPHLLNKIVYRFLRDSKAKRSYENSLTLTKLDINTPKPIGYIEFNSLLFFKESYYISEFFDYDFEIRAVFKDREFNNREIILEKFVEYSFNLHNKGVYHIDYSPGNILVKKVDDEYLFFIIDVNRMKFLPFDLDLRMKSMSKLTSNQQDNYFMADIYSKISNLDRDLLVEKFDLYLKKQEQYLSNKRKLKQMKS